MKPTEITSVIPRPQIQTSSPATQSQRSDIAPSGGIADTISRTVQTSGQTLASWLGWVNPTPAPITTHPVPKSKSKVVTENPVPAKENPHRSNRSRREALSFQQDAVQLLSPQSSDFEDFEAAKTLNKEYLTLTWFKELSIGFKIGSPEFQGEEHSLVILKRSPSGLYTPLTPSAVIINTPAQDRDPSKNPPFLAFEKTGLIGVIERVILQNGTIINQQSATKLNLETGQLDGQLHPGYLNSVKLTSSTGVLISQEGTGELNALMIKENADGTITGTPITLPGLSANRNTAIQTARLTDNSFLIKLESTLARLTLNEDHSVTVVTLSTSLSPNGNIMTSPIFGNNLLITESAISSMGRFYNGTSLGQPFPIPLSFSYSPEIIDISQTPSGNREFLFQTPSFQAPSGIIGSISIGKASYNPQTNTLDFQGTATINAHASQAAIIAGVMTDADVQAGLGGPGIISFSCTVDQCQVNAHRLDVDAMTTQHLVSQNVSDISGLFSGKMEITGPNIQVFTLQENPMHMAITKLFMLKGIPVANTTTTPRPASSSQSMPPTSAAPSSPSTSITIRPTTVSRPPDPTTTLRSTSSSSQTKQNDTITDAPQVSRSLDTETLVGIIAGAVAGGVALSILGYLVYSKIRGLRVVQSTEFKIADALQKLPGVNPDNFGFNETEIL